jgi:polyhydroxyalkanoate synthase
MNGTLQIGARAVSLRNLTLPILNIFARDDHLVPPAAARALRDLVATRDYTELELPGGTSESTSVPRRVRCWSRR